jgi:anaerobic selenocysteine-containing dehydrogenase/ferredoxin-NADP reductase
MVDIKAGFCTLCRSRCGSLNHVVDGHLIAVEPNPAHPTGAALCAKGRAAPEMIGSPRRLTKPLKRTRPRTDPDAGWVEISWNEALETIADKLGDIRSLHGAEAVAFAVTTPSGTPMVDSFEWVERFVRCFGSPNLIYAVEVCGWHKDYAQALTFGRGIGAADYDHADTIILWGHNPARTWLAQATRIAAAQRRGAIVAVVDPKRGGSGESADLWLPIRPGADGALAMGAIRHLLRHRTYDDAFVRLWTNAPMLVDRTSGRFLRASDVWPDRRDDAFVVATIDGTMRPYKTTTELDQPNDIRLEGVFEIAAVDGAILHCATVLTLLAEESEPYTPERVSEITRVAPADLARFYALFERSPRLAYHAWTGVGQHTNATLTERAIGTLYALTGASDRVGGNLWTVAPPARTVNDYTLLPAAQRAKALGLAELPLGPPARGWITARDFCHAVIEGEPYRVRALMSFGTNFVVSQGGSSRNRDALRVLDFHAHVDMFLNPTAASADIVLPANLPWEREALKIGFEITQEAVELVQLRQRIVPSLADCRADYDIVFDLACRLGHAEAFFDGSIEAGWNHQLEPLGLTVQDLRAAPEGIRVAQDYSESKYAKADGDGTVAGFATPSRRVELYSELLLSHGQPPLPGYVEPADSPASAEAALPLLLTTAKSGWYVHSAYRHIASLRRKAPDASLEIGSGTAATRGIGAGDWVVVQTAAGRARLRARVDPTLQDGVVIAEFGWWEDCPPFGRGRTPSTGPATSNINDALSDSAHDPISGSVPLRAVACDISRDDAGSRGLWPGQRAFRISSLRREAIDVMTVAFEPVDGGPLPNFLPGQHVTVSASTALLSRAYSLTGSCHQPKTLDIAVKLLGGGVLGAPSGRMSTHIHGLKTGSVVSLEAPRGIFTPPLSSDRPVVLMAAGIGITPFVGYFDALARSPASERPPSVRLLYFCRNGREHPFGPHLRALAATIPEVEATHVFTRPSETDVLGRDYDRVGRSALADINPQLLKRRPLAYICGPQAFIADAMAVLVKAGVPRFDVFSETFLSKDEIPQELLPRIVRLTRSDQRFYWSPQSGSLLDAADAAGISMPSGCRVGQCESCSIRVISGEFAHLAPYDGPPNYCLTCRAVPLGDLVLDA